MTPDPTRVQHLILASASPRRRRLLAEIGVACEVIPAHVDEWEATDADPAELVEHNAELKAHTVARDHPGRVVLGADTTVALGSTVLNKPRDLAEARRMLARLSGHAHEVHSAVCLCRDGGDFSEMITVTSRVFFHPLEGDIIERYLAKVDVLDKAGAYAIQENGTLLVRDFEGSFTNIVGLPLPETTELLERCRLADAQHLQRAIVSDRALAAEAGLR